MPKTNRKPKVRPRLVIASRQAFVRRYGPMQAHTGHDIDDYNQSQQDLWNVWEAARKWQRSHPKEE